MSSSASWRRSVLVAMAALLDTLPLAPAEGRAWRSPALLQVQSDLKQRAVSIDSLAPVFQLGFEDGAQNGGLQLGGKVATGRRRRALVADLVTSGLRDVPAAPSSWDNASKARRNHAGALLNVAANVSTPSLWSFSPSADSDRYAQLTGIGLDEADGSLPARHNEQPQGSKGLNGVRPPGLFLELQLPHTTLQELHDAAPRQSLVELLGVAQGELCAATGVQKARLKMVGMYGVYTRKRPNDFRLADTFTSSRAVYDEAGDVRTVEEARIRLLVLPTQVQGDVDAAAAVRALRKKLGQPGSALMRGPLGDTLHGAVVELQHSDTPRIPELRKTNLFYSMALPFGVSALFTGILVSFAAW